ncbi:MAG: uroporphyrinogen-III synthase [Gallionella sp.]|nr:uroporphyrinogen-III synthase [Gallionella sp.]
MAKLPLMDSAPPLAGLKIAVTRPRDQAVQLAQRIEQAGGIPFLFPLLDIAAVQDANTLHEQIARLAQFDLAIFISPNAVRYGVEAIRASNMTLTCSARSGWQAGTARRAQSMLCEFPASPPSPSDGTTSHSTKPASGQVAGYPARGRGELKIATVGQGSVQALRELGIANVIAPTRRFDSEGLLALPELQNVAGWRVMIFRGDGGRELLGDTLKARGAAVEYAACYRRSKPQQDVQALLDARPDAITVTSSEALGYLWQMLGDSAQTLLRDMPLFVPHARIAGLARQQGWKHVHLTGSGDDGLISALIAWAHQRTEEQGLRCED